MNAVCRHVFFNREKIPLQEAYDHLTEDQPSCLLGIQSKGVCKLVEGNSRDAVSLTQDTPTPFAHFSTLTHGTKQILPLMTKLLGAAFELGRHE